MNYLQAPSEEDHIMRVNKRDAERRLKEDHMIWVNKRDHVERRPKEVHMIWVNKKDEDLRMLASRIGK